MSDQTSRIRQALEDSLRESHTGVEFVGQGGMSILFRAFHTQLQQWQAIKVFFFQGPEIEELRDRFVREARSIIRLNHPHIRRVHDIRQDRERHLMYMIMDYIDGESLDAALERGPLPLPHAFQIARQVTEALRAAHAERIIHRDLKPGNVLLDRKGTAFLTDFGIARVETDEGLTKVNVIPGTVRYMAPELFAGAPASVRTDIFALGCVFYRMLTGTMPFPNGVLASGAPDPGVEGGAVSLRVVNPTIARHLDDLVGRMVRIDPVERPGSCDEVLDALRAIDETNTKTLPAPPPSPPAPVPPPADPWRRRVRLIAGALGGIGIAVVAFVLFWPKPPGPPNSEPIGGPPGGSLALRLIDVAGRATLGQPLRYRLLVGAEGPGEVRGAVVTDTLDPALELRSVSSARGITPIVNGRRFQIRYDSFAPNDADTINIEVVPISEGQAAIGGSVRWEGKGNDPAMGRPVREIIHVIASASEDVVASPSREPKPQSEPEPGPDRDDRTAQQGPTRIRVAVQITNLPLEDAGREPKILVAGIIVGQAPKPVELVAMPGDTIEVVPRMMGYEYEGSGSILVQDGVEAYTVSFTGVAVE